MNQDRISGVLLHVTSLPSDGGIGDFGPAAYEFVDFLAAAKQRLWQVLPLSPTGYGSSPYSALSAFAGNPALISLERLASEGWIAAERLQGLPGHDGPADFAAAAMGKIPLIEEAAANFLDHGGDEMQARYQRFCQNNGGWLQDYAMFNVLRRRFGYASWHTWPEELVQRKHDAMTAALTEHGRELAIEQAIQFFFDEQWSALRAYCKQRDIRILGDVAIFVNYDSADVWTHPELFELDDQLRMVRVSGVPPDYYSATGQRWGNPLYKWGEMREREFAWWVARVRRTLALYDMVRLDHFRGFEAYWSITADEPTAIHGQWVKAPGYELFQRLKDVFGDLPFIAEDLGLITPEVDALRLELEMPGMRVIQFGFSGKGAHLHLPHRYTPGAVAYTGTHDNDTTQGWWNAASKIERSAVEAYVGPVGKKPVWPLIRATEASVAQLAVVPAQDLLELGSEARMNTPAVAAGNWSWRAPEGCWKQELAARLAALAEVTDRDNDPLGEAEEENAKQG